MSEIAIKWLEIGLTTAQEEQDNPDGCSPWLMVMALRHACEEALKCLKEDDSPIDLMPEETHAHVSASINDVVTDDHG